MLKKQSILGVGITTSTKQEILEFIYKRIKTPHTKTTIVTPNPEIIMYAQKHLAYKDKLNSASIAMPDGVGIVFASKLLGQEMASRITGVDFIEELCKLSREKPLSMGFLGGRAGIAEQAAECLKEKYPWINVVYVSDEWSEEGFVNKKVSRMKYLVSSIKDKNIQNTKYKIPNTEIDILFVAFGAPKQEEWIFHNLENLPVKAAMGVGGAFDYLSGEVPRAPRFMRVIGLEWLYRLVRQPWRWKRQLSLPKFMILVLKNRFLAS